jgi:hypothetical protein
VRHLSPLTAGTSGRIRQLVGHLLGACLNRVTYHYLPTADSETYVGSGTLVDADIVAVTLELQEREVQVVSWAMAGTLEGLAALPQGSTYDGSVHPSSDVTDEGGWSGAVGTTIRSVAGAWHISDESRTPTLWALRLEFLATSVVLALGTYHQDIAYMPDELVVIFDRATAETYHPEHALMGSWGAPLPNDVPARTVDVPSESEEAAEDAPGYN